MTYHINEELRVEDVLETRNTMEYFVSVIIPTYKRANMLDRAIESVLRQTYADIEVVVVDDNDFASEWRAKTKEIMSKYNDNKQVKYICHEKNMNGSVARNTGIENAKGDVICFLDDDDEFHPEKIAKQVEYLKTHPEFRAVYCGWDRGQGIVLPTREGDLSFEILSGNHLIYTNTIMMYREDAIQFGGWDESFNRHQEAAFMMRFFKNGGKIGVVSENLVKFDISDRVNEAQNSRIYEEQMRHYLTVFEEQIQKCNHERRDAAKFIYTNRYRGVFFAHIKNRNFAYARKLYFEMVKKYPFMFHWSLCKYVFKKMIGAVRNE